MNTNYNMINYDIEFPIFLYYIYAFILHIYYLLLESKFSFIKNSKKQ